VRWVVLALVVAAFVVFWTVHAYHSGYARGEMHSEFSWRCNICRHKWVQCDPQEEAELCEESDREYQQFLCDIGRAPGCTWKSP
jgi:hypothetical protein